MAIMDSKYITCSVKILDIVIPFLPKREKKWKYGWTIKYKWKRQEIQQIKDKKRVPISNQNEITDNIQITVQNDIRPAYLNMTTKEIQVFTVKS